MSEHCFLVLFVGWGSCSCWPAEISSIHPHQCLSFLLIWGPEKGEQTTLPPGRNPTVDAWLFLVKVSVASAEVETLAAPILLPVPVRNVVVPTAAYKDRTKQPCFGCSASADARNAKMLPEEIPSFPGRRGRKPRWFLTHFGQWEWVWRWAERRCWLVHCSF